MNILHIAVDYPNTALYKQLLMHCSPNNGQYHTVYVPARIGADVSLKNHYEAQNVEVLYSADFHQIDRLLYHRKRLQILAGIERQVPLKGVRVVHAHTLFSSGGVAYELKRTRGIEYVVAVRNTDLNVFFKYAIHLRRFGLRILQEAARVVFLSPAYLDTLVEQYAPAHFRQELIAKSIVIPNGISDFWLENRFQRPPRSMESRRLNLAYVGAFTKNKNVETTLLVAEELVRRGYEPHLTLVGDGPEAPRIKKLATRMTIAPTVRSWTENQQQLLDVYRGADLFLMPSLTETFGLVYAEAMSQGLPVIYTRGQGIDGYFPDGTVGYACQPTNVRQISDKAESVLQNYNRISLACTELAGTFSWTGIAANYENLYHSVAERNSTEGKHA